MKEVKAKMKSLDFDPYIYECWEVKNAKSERELLLAIEEAILDIFYGMKKGIVTRPDGWMRKQIHKWEELEKFWLDKDYAGIYPDLVISAQQEFPYYEKDSMKAGVVTHE